MKNIIFDNRHWSNISINDYVSMLNSSRKFFLSPSCVSGNKIADHVLEVLDEHKIPKSVVYEEIDTNMMNSGDYLIRCFGRMIQVWEIEVIPFGITTRLLENLEGFIENSR